MRRWVVVLVVGFVGLAFLGLLFPAIQRARLEASKAECLKRFQSLGQFAAIYNKPPDGFTKEQIPQAIPPGTLVNPRFKPDERLSWIVEALPFFDQHYGSTWDLATKFDRAGAWNSETNLEYGRTRLSLFTMPNAIPEVAAGEPMPTQFVGLAGVGADTPEMPFIHGIPNRAGCFRYHWATPLDAVRKNDGLSNTFLFGETAMDLGPWARGGFSTVRYLDASDGAKPFLGAGGQFGGHFPNLVGFGTADGGAKFHLTRMNPAVLKAHFTIAGWGFDTAPGD